MGQPCIRTGKIMHSVAPAPVRACKDENRGGGSGKKGALPWLCVVLLLSVLAGCGKKPPESAPMLPPPAPVGMEQPETFVHNLRKEGQELTTWREMAPTLRKSLNYVNSKSPSGVAIDRPGLRLTWGDMANTLRTLQTLLPLLDEKPELFLERFRWVEVPQGIMYSGYYEPVLKASRTYKPGWYPLYKRPPELSSYRSKGRPYHTRKAIDGKKVLANRGLELAWAESLVDIFYLQIQGSGRLAFEDGSQAFVNYDGQNGHKYISSGRIMAAKGLLKQGHIYEQRDWFKKNPDRIWEILQDNPSYVFFKFGHRGPTGAMGQVVDGWMSLATARDFIPLGSVVAYGVNIPDAEKGTAPLRGIGFAQDVGGAIKKNRIDIFCGGDERANYVASHLDAKGPAWVLVAK